MRNLPIFKKQGSTPPGIGSVAEGPAAHGDTVPTLQMGRQRLGPENLTPSPPWQRSGDWNPDRTLPGPTWLLAGLPPQRARQGPAPAHPSGGRSTLLSHSSLLSAEGFLKKRTNMLPS